VFHVSIAVFCSFPLYKNSSISFPSAAAFPPPTPPNGGKTLKKTQKLLTLWKFRAIFATLNAGRIY
jgi:hypothetical protein